MILRAGDIFVTRGDSLLGLGIRWFSRTKGEDDTDANHVGIITQAGTHQTAHAVEALNKVKGHKLYDQYGGKVTGVRVWRKKGLTVEQGVLLARNAESRVGQRYGTWKLGVHALDRWLFGGRVVLRDWLFFDNAPICSYLVADVYNEVLGYKFGIKPEAAQPDDIDDWCRDHPDQWDQLTPMLPLDSWDRWLSGMGDQQ